MVFDTEETDTGEQKVRVLFLNPTHMSMVPCRFFMNGECKFDEDKCRCVCIIKTWKLVTCIVCWFILCCIEECLDVGSLDIQMAVWPTKIEVTRPKFCDMQLYSLANFYFLPYDFCI